MTSIQSGEALLRPDFVVSQVSAQSNHRFVIWLLATFVLVLGSVGMFNYVVDPYDVFHHGYGLSREQKPLVSRHLRLVKAADVRRLQPAAIVLGSSRVLLGMDPRDLDAATGQKFYNFGVAACSMRELYAHFQHALFHNPALEHVVIGVDLFAFNENRKPPVDFSRERLSRRWLSWTDYFSLLCAVQMCKESLKTLDIKGRWSVKDTDGALTETGFLSYALLARRMNEIQTQQVEVDQKILETYHTEEGCYGRYALCQEALDEFACIVHTCRERNIRLDVFMTPCRVPYWHTLYLKDQWKSLRVVKSALVSLTDLWDFSGVLPMNDEPYDQQSQNYLDIVHMYPSLGDKVFAIMNSGNPDESGYRVTQATFVAHENKLEEKQRLWASQHPEWDGWIREQLPKWEKQVENAL